MKKNSEKFIDNTANYNIINYFKQNFLVEILEKYNSHLLNNEKNVTFLNTSHFLIPHNNNKYYLCVIPKYLIDKTSIQNYDILYFFNSSGDSFFIELNINNFNVFSSNKSNYNSTNNTYLFECFLYSVNNTQTNHTGLENYECHISDILIYKNEICNLDYVSRHNLCKNFYIFKNNRDKIMRNDLENIKENENKTPFSIYSNDIQFRITDYITITTDDKDNNSTQLMKTYIQNSSFAYKIEYTHIDKIYNVFNTFKKEMFSLLEKLDIDLNTKQFTIERSLPNSTLIISDIYYLYDTSTRIQTGVLYIPTLKCSKYIKTLFEKSFSIIHNCKFNHKFKKWELDM